MAGTIVESVDSATQTSDFGSDDEEPSYSLHEMGSLSPRAVVDTSPPFGSVEEAVIRFGGRGFWIPQSVVTADAATATDDQCQFINSEVHKLDDRAAAMLKDLQKKEQETHEILKELELTKRLVEELKQKLPKEEPAVYVNKYPVDHSTNQPINKTDEQLNTFPSSAAGLIMMELKQTKQNLNQNTNDLAELRASVKALSKKMDKEKVVSSVDKARELSMVGSINPLAISRELRELNYEAEQFMKTAEAAKSEVLKAMSDVEETKTGLKVVEMRWIVAKKLEDAARAAETLALAELRALSSNTEGTGLFDQGNYQQKQGRISLSVEEYSALTDKARKAENLIRMREMNGFKKIEEQHDEEKQSNMAAFQNSFTTRPARRDSRLLDSSDFEFDRCETKPVRRGTTSIGDILSRKLVLRDDLEVGRQEENVGAGRPRVSLNQMLRRHRGETTSPPKRREREGNEGKNFFFSKRKALGFVHIALPLTKQSKNNKIQALNLWRGEDE